MIAVKSPGPDGFGDDVDDYYNDDDDVQRARIMSYGEREGGEAVRKPTTVMSADVFVGNKIRLERIRRGSTKSAVKET